MGLIATSLFSSSKCWRGRLVCLAGIGVSLCIKHILFLFPFWLAFKEKGWKRKILVIAIPYTIFILGFTFYWVGGYSGILKNVFLYKSSNVGPFWQVFAPNIVYTLVPKITLFIAALLAFGLYFKNKTALDSLNYYLVALVIFSSAAANQYLAIPIAPISILWNGWYAIYSAIGGIFLLGHHDGLDWALFRRVVQIGYWYEVLIVILFLGFLTSSFGKIGFSTLLNPIRKLFDWLKIEIKDQFKWENLTPPPLRDQEIYLSNSISHR